jgi:quercetin dioxygenase-like cupin family protein
MSVVHLENVAETVFAPEAKVRFVHGESMTLAYWSFTPSDFQPPPHSHPHEQLIQVLDGTLEVWIEGTSTILGPGSVALVAPDKLHWARAVTDCRVLDIFHPVREDYRSGDFGVIQA